MDRPGEKLKRARERLGLTYRDVEQFSQEIARMRGSDEFSVALSRLADIENKGTVPSIYRLYTLCAIYRLDYDEVLCWYGVPREELAADSLRIGLAETHVIGLPLNGELAVPHGQDREVDLSRTTLLSHLARRWGKLPLGLNNGMESRHLRYGMMGLEDWSMYPILHPGALFVIDESRRKVASGGWSSEFDRPIYFLEHREGYLCGWCTLVRDRLVVQAHPASQREPGAYAYPSEVEVVGQVVGVAMRFDAGRSAR